MRSNGISFPDLLDKIQDWIFGAWTPAGGKIGSGRESIRDEGTGVSTDQTGIAGDYAF
jgi:hypothetical protein